MATKTRSGPTGLRLGLALLLAAPSLALADAPTAAAARLEIEKSEIDLGQIVRGETAEATFVLRNRGDAVLEIRSVKPG